MKTEEFYRRMRKIYMTHLLWPIVPIVVSIIFLVIIPFDEIIRPVRVNSISEAVEAVENGHEYLEISITRLIYSGYDYMRDEEVYGQYYYELIDGKECVFFLLEPSGEDDNVPYMYRVNKLVKVEEKNGIFDNMINMFANTINWTEEGVSSITKDYVLSEVNYHYYTYTTVLILILTILIYGIVVFVYNLAIALTPQLSPKLIAAMYMYKGKRVKGIKHFVEMLCNEIDNANIIHGNMYITEHYIINLDKYDFDLVPIDRIVLAYEHGNLKSFMGIHLKVMYTIHLKANNILRYHIGRKTLEEANSVLDYLRINYPDVLIGYTDENKQLVKEAISNTKNN